MKVAVVKYNAGNVLSVLHALKRLGTEPVVTADPAELQTADKVVFPGVGEASSAMRCLQEHGLDRALSRLKQPVLGICLGLQLFCAVSEENNAHCLGIFPLQVRRLPPLEKVPHIGWNLLGGAEGPLFAGLPERPYVYFVHGYYAELCPFTLAHVTYGIKFSAAIGKDNFYAVQFHPEKSGEIGAQILRNFLDL